VRGGFKIGGGGNLDSVAPDGLYLKTDYEGEGSDPAEFSEANHSDILVFGRQVYLKTPVFGDDWVLFTPAELAADWDVLQRLIGARSPLNYGATVATLTELEDLGDDEIEDGVYRHYRGTSDAAALARGLADAYGSQGQIMLVDRFSGPIPVDIWIDRANLLPRTVKAAGPFEFLGKGTDLAITVTFTGYGEAVVLPGAPKNVKSASALLAGE
jgi:hypothetical protein